MDTQTTTVPAVTDPAPVDATPVDYLRRTLAEIELDTLTSYTLADAIREGCTATTQAVGSYGAGFEACAMSAGVLAARARGYIG
jgi:hypothetical protein